LSSATHSPKRIVGAVLAVQVVDDEPLKAEYDPEETKRRRERARDRFDRLSKRPDETE
jgi:hypothetical protein